MRGIRMNLAASAAFAATVTGSLCLPAAADPEPETTPAAKPAHPAVFCDTPYADALAANKASDKLLVVKATAVWCGPCKKMDRTTFVDPKVISWFGSHGTIIEIDVDKQPEVAKELRIRAMPTTIAFRKGEELDRVVGYRDGPSLLSWLEDAKAGKKAGEELAIKVEKAAEGGVKVGMQDRMVNARNLVTAGKLDKATEEYLWLWANIAKEEPAMAGVRGSFLAGDIGRLIDEHEPARGAFAKVRDEAEARLKADNKSFDDLNDWIVLNQELGQPEKTLQWFDRIKDQEGSDKTLNRVAFRLERLLEEHGRLGDLGKLERNPLGKLKQAHAMMAFVPRNADPEQARQMAEVHRSMFRGQAATLYTSLLLAAREDEAAKVAAEAVKLDDTGAMRIALVRKAADNKAARPAHLELLREAKTEDEFDAVKAAVEKQLGRVN